MSSFANQVVLITGAGSGLGWHLALALAEEGARIAALDQNETTLAALVAALPGKPVATAVADVTDGPAQKEAIAKLVAQLGPIDLLIASAGIGLKMYANDFRTADLVRLLNVNLVGVAHSIEAVLPSMRERRRGHIAALSSLASFRGFPGIFGYSASKAGLSALCDGLRMELAEHGIAVTILCPGWVRTPMTADLALPAGEVLEPADAARRILDGLRRRQPLVAFPFRGAWKARIVSLLPKPWGDWLAWRFLRGMEARQIRST